MGLHPKLGALTERQKKRLFLMKELGCTCCHIVFGRASPGGQGHHAEDRAGRAISHDALIVLCDWHHNGKPLPPGAKNEARALVEYGPSRHRHAVAFAEFFGTDEQLLEIQNARLAGYLTTFVISPF